MNTLPISSQFLPLTYKHGRHGSPGNVACEDEDQCSCKIQCYQSPSRAKDGQWGLGLRVKRPRTGMESTNITGTMGYKLSLIIASKITYIKTTQYYLKLLRTWGLFYLIWKTEKKASLFLHWIWTQICLTSKYSI